MRASIPQYRSRVFQRALTLIELVGVLAIIAILAGVLLPALVRQMDKVAAENETAMLKSIGDALQRSILRHRYVPGHTNWAAVAANELSASLADITTTPRKHSRVFLVDPTLEIGAPGGVLPYTQNNAGSVIVSNGAVVPPINPRIILVSTIGHALPTNVVTGIPSETDFNALWNWNDAGTIPPASATWTGWPGKTEDLRVHRVNLSPLFVRLVLTTYASSGLGRYSIDWLATNSVSTNLAGVDAYFIQSSVLALHTHQGSLDSQQVLIADSSFVYDQNAWRSSISGNSPIGSLDLGDIVDRFLRSPANNNAANGPAQQGLVVQSMMDYMISYESWANEGFPTSGSSATYTAAKAAQSTMMTHVQQLYTGGSYYPTEQPCPP